MISESSKIIHAIADLRYGLPIIAEVEQEKIALANILNLSGENLHRQLSDLCCDISDLKIAIPRLRMSYLYNINACGIINLGKLDNSRQNFSTIMNLATSINTADLPAIEDYQLIHDDRYDFLHNLQIAAELLPTFIFHTIKDKKIWEKSSGSISATNYHEFCDSREHNLAIRKICSTNLKVKLTDSQVLAFRHKYSDKEHYAFIVKPSTDLIARDKDISIIANDSSPLVRVHSSCFTGDLLTSLDCDCYDQLHTSLEYMARYGGGILIYLNEEGRGIGLLNKLLCYNLKEQGIDTFEANQALGFADDYRNFSIAIEILKELKINKIRLMTNNPQKQKLLQNGGIKVESIVGVMNKVHDNIYNYYKAKQEKKGHKLSFVLDRNA